MKFKSLSYKATLPANSVVQLNSLTQTYVTNTESLVASAKTLGQQAGKLTGAIAYFKI